RSDDGDPADPEAAQALRDGRAGQAADEAGASRCHQPVAGRARVARGAVALNAGDQRKEIAMSTMHSLLAASILALAGCNSVASGNADAPGTGRAANGNTIADGSTFDMRPGQSVTLADGSALRYERLVNESRCMPDVQCVWAGDAEVAFTWKPVNGPAEAFKIGRASCR